MEIIIYFMGFFGKKKRVDTLDLTRGSGDRQALPIKSYNVSKEGVVDLRQNRPSPTKTIVPVYEEKAPKQESRGGFFSFLDSSSSSSSNNSSEFNQPSNPILEVSEISDLKNKLRSITSRMEDQSNEVYRLMHRIELLEKKIERLEGR